MVFNMIQQHQILQILPTEVVLTNQDRVRYNINELRCIRSDCQKNPPCKIIPWSTLQCRSLNILGRCRGRRGGVTKEALKNSNHKVNKLITLDTLKLDLSHLTLNELNDSGLNLKIGTGNLQSIKGKAIILQDYLLDSNMDVFMAMETWHKDNDDDKVWLLGSCLNKGEFKYVTSSRSVLRREEV